MLELDIVKKRKATHLIKEVKALHKGVFKMITLEVREKAIDLYYAECENLKINPSWCSLDSNKQMQYINRVK
jgi:hypothetical protein